MAMTVALVTDQRFEELDEDQGRALIDLQARKFLGMSGTEFIQKYYAGQIENPDSTDVLRVAMLLPFLKQTPDGWRESRAGD